VSTRECFAATEIENNGVRIDKLDRILGFDIRDPLRLPPEFRKDHKEKTEKERGNQQHVIPGEF
jgi:hypothetical protein